jgi:nucleotide-binding universal stress UspA family protein
MIEQIQPRRVLVATDFSPGAEGALAWAKALATAFQLEVVLLHVVDFSRFPPQMARVPDAEGILDRFRAEADEEMAKMAARFPSARSLLREGSTRATILEVANEIKADIIVMGTHGHTGFTHAFFGSVAEYVVRNSRVPVLTVRQHSS